MKKLVACLCLEFLFFPFFSGADAPLPSVYNLKTELVHVLRQEGFVIEEPALPEYGGGGDLILATIPARDDEIQAPQTDAPSSPEIFILGTPLSDRGNARGNFPFAIETVIAFLKAMKGTETDKRIAAAFWGSDDGEFRGLEDLIPFLDYPENAVLTYLDFSFPPEEIAIHHGVRGGISPLAIVRPLSGALEKKDIPYRFNIHSHELYNLGLAEGPAVLEYAHAQEIPAVLLTAAGDVSGGVTAELLAEALAGYARAVRWKTGGLDTHYSLFSYGDHIFFLSEGLTLILILFLAGTGIALWLIRSMPGGLKKRYPLKPGAPHQSEPQETPQQPPSVSSEPVPFPGRYPADHCAHIAIFLAILGILGGTLLDLSCAPAFIWNLAFTILGATLRLTPAVFICALLSPFKGIETIFQTLREGVFTGSLRPEIYPVLALLVLPCLLLVLRGIILVMEQRVYRKMLRIANEKIT